MRASFHRLFSKLGAPRVVRSWFLSSGKTRVALSGPEDLVSEFYRELGLKMGKVERKSGLIKRLNRGMWRWTTSYSVLLAVAVAIAGHVTTTGPFVAFLAFVVAVVAGGVASELSENQKEIPNCSFFLVYFGEMVGLWLASFFFNLPLAWLPVSILSVFWLMGGLLHMWRGEEKVSEQRTPEEWVTEAFSQLLRQRYPDLDKKRASSDSEIAVLSSQIEKAKDALAKMEGELSGDDEHSGRWSSIIKTDIARMKVGIAEKEAKKEVLERVRRELLSRLQHLEASKDEAATAIRLEGHRRAGFSALDLADEAATRGGTYLMSVVQDLHEAVRHFDRAVEALGLATLPGLEDGGSVDGLIAGAEAVGKSAGRRLNIVND